MFEGQGQGSKFTTALWKMFLFRLWMHSVDWKWKWSWEKPVKMQVVTALCRFHCGMAEVCGVAVVDSQSECFLITCIIESWVFVFPCRYNTVDMCVAVATDTGLITPIVFGADRKVSISCPSSTLNQLFYQNAACEFCVAYTALPVCVIFLSLLPISVESAYFSAWWPNRLELRSVCTYVRPHNFFSDFDLIWCVGRPRPDVHTSMTRSKVKIKVTELLKFRKLHFSTSIFSTILAWSSKLMVDYDNMGPNLQLVRARFLNFLLSRLSCDFKLRGMSILRTSKGQISILLEAGVTWSGVLVVLYVLCMLIWPWSNRRWRSRGDDPSEDGDVQPPSRTFIQISFFCLINYLPHLQSHASYSFQHNLTFHFFFSIFSISMCMFSVCFSACFLPRQINVSLSHYHHQGHRSKFISWGNSTTTATTIVLYGPFSGTARVSHYQKKHSLTHHPDHM